MGEESVQLETSVAGGAQIEVAHDVAAASEALSQPQSAPRPSLWRNREFRIVLFGQTISIFGDAISFTALPLLVVLLTGSGVAMGTVGVLQTLPDLILGLPAGALADRWDRRKLVIYADLGRAVLTALVPLSILLGWPTMAIIILVAFPINALRVLFMAGWTAIMPSGRGARPGRSRQRLRGGDLQPLVHRGSRDRGCARRRDRTRPDPGAGRRLVPGLGRRDAPDSPAAQGRAIGQLHTPARRDIAEGLRYLVGHPCCDPRSVSGRS